MIARIVLAVALLATPSVAGAASATSLGPVLASQVWHNGHPSAASLKGKVVLVDVFTVDCVNCRNVTPNLVKLSSSLRGKLVIIGVHTPETRYERDPRHVVDALGELGITWPVAVDDDQRLWNAYGIEYWPTQMLFDKSGKLRKTVVGDSQDGLVDDAIRELLTEPSP